MATFFCADWHLGEDRFEIMQRPFTTQEEMIEVLIANHNALVAPDDEVHVVGDVCYQKTPEFLPMVERFNGRKILYRGNHDRVFSDSDLEPYFDKIVAEGGGVGMAVCGVTCYVTHYPTQGAEDVFNLVGHIHGAWKYQLNMLNVGVDVNHFRPVHEEQIPFFLKAITEFYDRDVWVAYDSVNELYRYVRGKKTRYLDQ